MYQNEEYFNNILSRSWLGQKKDKTSTSIEKSHITDIYLDVVGQDKLIIVGKTEIFFFILEGYESEGYCYSNVLFNDNFFDLISSYKNRDSITCGKNIDDFVSSVLLDAQLLKYLPIKSKKI